MNDFVLNPLLCCLYFTIDSDTTIFFCLCVCFHSQYCTSPLRFSQSRMNELLSTEYVFAKTFSFFLLLFLFNDESTQTTKNNHYWVELSADIIIISLECMDFISFFHMWTNKRKIYIYISVKKNSFVNIRRLVYKLFFFSLQLGSHVRRSHVYLVGFCVQAKTKQKKKEKKEKS